MASKIMSLVSSAKALEIFSMWARSIGTIAGLAGLGTEDPKQAYLEATNYATEQLDSHLSV